MNYCAPRSLFSSLLGTALILQGVLVPVNAESRLSALESPESHLLGLDLQPILGSSRERALYSRRGQDSAGSLRDERSGGSGSPERVPADTPAGRSYIERQLNGALQIAGERLSGVFSNKQQFSSVLEGIKKGEVDLRERLLLAGQERVQSMVDAGLDRVEQRFQNRVLRNLELSYRAPFAGREDLFHANATLSLWENSENVLFGQGGLVVRDGEEGANLGLGYRFLAGPDLLLGANTFYDYLSDPSVERWSLGAEARSSWLDLYGNWYQGSGDDREGSTRYYSPDGWDVELAAHLPQAPWVELGASYYLWDGEGSQDDLEGQRYRLSLKPFSLLSMDLEYDDPDEGDGSWGVELGLNYQFGVSLSRQLDFIGQQGTPDLWSRRYEKVEREYAIRVREQRTAPAGVTVGQTVFTVSEDGGTGTYTLVLNTAPTADVIIAVASSDTLAATVSSTSLTFTPTDWNTAQTVTVTGVSDTALGGRTAIVTHTAASGDTVYDRVAIDPVTVTVTDDDTAGVTVSETTRTVAEDGGTDTYTVVLNTLPLDNVTITPASSDTDVAIVSAALTFTSSTWDTPQTVTVTGVNDDDHNSGDERTATVTHTVESTGDPIYAAVTIASVTVTVVDDDDETSGDVTVTLETNIAGDDNIVNIAERAAGFNISGTVPLGTTEVSVTIGTGMARTIMLSSTTTWTIAIPADATDITGTSVDVVATATMGSLTGMVTRTIGVDLVAPTAGYTPPGTLMVGMAILDIEPDSPSADISSYALQAGSTLPPGLTLASDGVISGTPTTANTNPATVTIGLTDTAGNPTDVSLTFPAVSLGSQMLVGFAYSANTATLGQTAPTVTAPTGAQTSDGSTLSYTSGDTAICTVEPDTGALTLVAAGDCVITVTASATANYNGATADFTITVSVAAPSISIVADTSPVTEGEDATFTLTADSAPVGDLTITVTVTDSGNFIASVGAPTMVTIADGTMEATLTVPTEDDSADEADGMITATVETGAGYTVDATNNSASVTVNDDDALPTLAIDSPSVAEGDAGSTTLSYTVTLTGETEQEVTVDYADAGVAGGGTATSGADYTAITAGTLTFAPGTTTQNIDVTVMGDTMDEPNETVILTLSGETNATITTPDGTGTITNDDGAVALPSISIAAGTAVDEGTAATFTLTADSAPVGNLTVTVTVTDSGNFIAGAAPTTVTITGGATTAMLEVPTMADSINEANGTITATVETGAGYTVDATNNSASVTVNDDDALPTLAIDSPSVAEGDAGSTTLSYTVTLTGETEQEVTVDYADAGVAGGGTATSGADYTAITAGTLTFAPGTTTQNIDVTVMGDTMDEPNETVILTLSGETNATITTPDGTGTITNDDGAVALPSISIAAGTAVDEGTAATFTLTADSAPVGNLTVTVTVTDSGNFIAGAAPTTVTITGGATTAMLEVPTMADSINEANGTITATVETGAGYTVDATNNSASVTVNDDDALPTLAIDSPSVAEGDAGSTTLSYTVTLTGETEQEVTVDYADAGVAGGGTATSGADYTAITAGTLTFAPGTTTQNIDVTVMGDTMDEPNETVILTLSGETNATITTPDGTGTITNDDGAVALPSISIAAGTAVDEGTAATFTLTADSAPVGNLTVTVTVTDSGNFIAGAAPTTVTITGGATTAMLEVPTMADSINEANGTITATVETGAGYTVDATNNSASVTVNDDDALPTLAIDSPSVAEGDAGSTTLSYTVTLTGETEQEVTVDYADAGVAGGGTATSGADYTAITAGTLTFAPGTTTQNIDVTVMGDTMDEPNETVILTLSGETNATITTPDGTGTITNDDGAVALPSISIAAGTAVDEGTAATFTLTADSAPVGNLTVTVTVTDSGNFIAGAAPTTVTITGGATTAMLEVPTMADSINEANGMITATVETGAGYTVDATNNSASVTVNDDDALPTLAIDSPSVAEGDAGSTTLSYTVTLTGETEQEVTVDYADAGVAGGGTATSGADYTAITAGTLTFAPGTTTQNIDVTVMGDTMDEPNETVILTLSGETNATITTPDGTGTITNDDGAVALPSISIAAGTAVDEGTAATFTLTADSAPVGNLTVTVTVTDSGNFIAGAAPTTVTITGGATTAMLEVPTMADSINEANGMITATVETGAGYTVDATNNSASVTVNDDDALPTLAIDSPSVAEGDAGSTTLSYTVTLTGETEQEVTVDYADAGVAGGGTATSGADYTAITAGTLTFAPGTTTQNIDVTVMGDTMDEPNETVILTLSGETNATITTPDGTGTITNDDGAVALPSISIAAGTAVDEGTAATFTLTADSAPVGNLTVTVTVTDSGNFIAGAAPTTVTITGGATTAMLEVPTMADSINEANGMITATVETGAGYTVDATNNSASVTVNDDDALPTLAIDSPSVAEGDAGSTTLSYTVTLTGETEQEVTVDYADAGVAGGGTATSGADYTAITAGTLTFAPGTTTQNIDVTVMGDTMDEPNETVILTLSGETNATITTPDGTGTITNDDGAVALPSISIAAGTAVDEGTAATFTLTADSAPVGNLTVTVTVTDSGNFIAGAAPTTVTITGGATTAMLEVPTMADSINEANGTITATVETGAGYTVDATNNSASVTVNDDDALPTLAIDSPSVAEGDAGSTTLSYTVTLTGETEQEVTVDYADAGVAGGGTATSGADYTAITAGTLTFAPGTTTQNIDVTVMGDTMDEPNETVILTLSGETNATITTPDGTGTITNDDGAVALPSISIAAGTAVDEGTAATFTLTADSAPVGAAVPSSTAVPAAMEMLGNATAPSSLVIVPVPSGVVIVALVSPDRVRMTVSFGSSIVSPITVTSMFCVVVPGAKVSVPAVIAV